MPEVDDINIGDTIAVDVPTRAQKWVEVVDKKEDCVVAEHPLSDRPDETIDVHPDNILMTRGSGDV